MEQDWASLKESQVEGFLKEAWQKHLRYCLCEYHSDVNGPSLHRETPAGVVRYNIWLNAVAHYKQILEIFVQAGYKEEHFNLLKVF